MPQHLYKYALFRAHQRRNLLYRTAQNTDGKKMAHRGDEMPFGGEVSDNGWLKVLYKDQKAWVSGKQGRTE